MNARRQPPEWRPAPFLCQRGGSWSVRVWLADGRRARITFGTVRTMTAEEAARIADNAGALLAARRQHAARRPT